MMPRYTEAEYEQMMEKRPGTRAVKRPAVTQANRQLRSLKHESDKEKHEGELFQQIVLAGLPIPERDYLFCPPRRFKFDLAFKEERFAVEIDGAIWQGGRHGTGTGILTDCEKGFYALANGWRVLRVAGDHVTSGQALQWIEKLLRG